MRVDTTVVETNIHYPTDSTLLGDGVRVLTRTMKRITADRRGGGRQAARPHAERQAPAAPDRPGPRSRSEQGQASAEARCYRQLLAITGRVVGQAKRFVAEMRPGVKRSADRCSKR